MGIQKTRGEEKVIGVIEITTTTISRTEVEEIRMVMVIDKMVMIIGIITTITCILLPLRMDNHNFNMKTSRHSIPSSINLSSMLNLGIRISSNNIKIIKSIHLLEKEIMVNSLNKNKIILKCKLLLAILRINVNKN